MKWLGIAYNGRMKILYPTAVLMATIGVGVQANELNITKPEVGCTGSMKGT